MAQVILALDLPTRDDALRLLDRLPRLRWVKLGPILMTAADGGPGLVRELVGRGLAVFLDLKWHDIPNTVRGAVQAAAGLGVRMVTVHTVGGRDMMQAAVRAGGASLAVVGVTVLTSTSRILPTDYPDEMTIHQEESVKSVKSVGDAVMNLARSAMSAGLAGVVCSPLEIQGVRSAIGPEALIVVPGIRRRQDDVNDQARVAGPREAALAGASHLVVGRPILTAKDPPTALDDFLAAVS
ncbi:MAG: orotidine-5'-phosphate decarboxylase [Gemmatimonadales bacterium]